VLLGSVTDTVDLHFNEFPITVEDLDVDILKAIAVEALGPYEGRTLVKRLYGILTQVVHV
jgi:hypothetical protein